MQKLVFTNSKGVSVDLTSGDFGITNWKGFDNTGLNLQTQTVPFTDGSVYIDGLLNNRDLTVTLALQDDGNLEKRYELKRRLIEILNPKLGEGVLVYTNDYLSKQIKVVPSIPLFANKNSNDRGTQKGNLVFTACNPYWEDMEETVVDLKSGARQVVENKGDVPCSITADLYITNTKNFELKNFTQNKKIKIEGDIDFNIAIDTSLGKKNVYKEIIDFNNILKTGINYNDLCCDNGKTVLVGDNGFISVRKDGAFNPCISGTTENLKSVIYVKEISKYIAVGTSGVILTSVDAKEWVAQNSGTTENLNFVFFCKDLNLIIVAGDSGTILKSDVGVDWDIVDGGTTENLNGLTYDAYLQKLFFVGDFGLILSTEDLENFTSTTQGNENFKAIEYSERENRLVAIMEQTFRYDSQDGITWNEQDVGIPINTDLSCIKYIQELNLFFIGGKYVYSSRSGLDWTEVLIPDRNVNCIKYDEENLQILGAGNEGYIISSYDGEDFTREQIGRNQNLISIFADNEIFIGGENNFNYYGEDINDLSIKWLYASNSMPLKTVSVAKKGSDLYILCKDTGSGKYIFKKSEETYTQLSISGLGLQTYNSLIYSEEKDLFVIVGNNGQIATSTDCQTFTSQTSGVSRNLLSVCYSEEKDLFVIVGTNGKILTSSNGTSWTSRTGGTGQLNDVKFFNGKFVVAGNSGVVLTSSNGTSWVKENSGSSTNLNSVCFSESLNIFAFCGNNGTVLMTKNCIDFLIITINLSVDINAIGIKDNTFILACDNGVIFTSEMQIQESIIDRVSEDTSMNLSLECGENEIAISTYNEVITGKLKYRQRYVGV